MRAMCVCVYTVYEYELKEGGRCRLVRPRLPLVLWPLCDESVNHHHQSFVVMVFKEEPWP